MNTIKEMLLKLGEEERMRENLDVTLNGAVEENKPPAEIIHGMDTVMDLMIPTKKKYDLQNQRMIRQYNSYYGASRVRSEK